MSWTLTINGDDGKGLREQLAEIYGEIAMFGGPKVQAVLKQAAVASVLDEVVEAKPSRVAPQPAPPPLTPRQQSIVNAPIQTQVEKPAELVVEEPKKIETRGRKPKPKDTAKTADLAADMLTQARTPQAEPASMSLMPSSLPPPSDAPIAGATNAVASDMSELIAALSEVCDSVSMDAGREVLAQFGVNKTRELKPPQHAKFIEACKLKVSQIKAG